MPYLFGGLKREDLHDVFRFAQNVTAGFLGCFWVDSLPFYDDVYSLANIAMEITQFQFETCRKSYLCTCWTLSYWIAGGYPSKSLSDNHHRFMLGISTIIFGGKILISHPGKRKIIFKSTFGRGYVGPQEGRTLCDQQGCSFFDFPSKKMQSQSEVRMMSRAQHLIAKLSLGKLRSLNLRPMNG